MRRLLIPAMLLVAAAGDPSSIDVAHPWARATPPAARNGVVYVTLTEKGPPDRLTGVSTPAAEMAEVHESLNDNGVMKMRPIAGGIALDSGKSVAFEPGGRHIMLMGLKAPLKAGDKFPITFVFAHAAPMTVSVTVEGMSGNGMNGHQMH